MKKRWGTYLKAYSTLTTTTTLHKITKKIPRLDIATAYEVVSTPVPSEVLQNVQTLDNQQI